MASGLDRVDSGRKRLGTWVALATVVHGCQTSSTITDGVPPPGSSNATSNLSGVPLVPASGVSPASIGDELPARGSLPDWAVGKWVASGTTTVTHLQLPNDQGVQLAWLKDAGKQHIGPLELSLTLAANGVATGKLTGVLGDLSLEGLWPSAGPLHLELRPAAEGTDVFHGTLTVTWNAQIRRGRALLKATSGDGRWLRAANLEVTRSS